MRYTCGRLVLILFMAAPFGSAQAANYATCLLDNLPGVRNGSAHAAALTMCEQKYPRRFFEIQKGSGRSILNRQTAAECTLAKGRDTSYAFSAGMIQKSCECLYGPKATSDVDTCEVDWSQFTIVR